MRYVIHLNCDRNGCGEVWVGGACDSLPDAIESARRQAAGAGWVRHYELIDHAELMFCPEHAAPES